MERSGTQEKREPRRGRGAAEWKKEVKAWKASGEPAATYAAKHGLNPSTLMWWGSALKREDRGGRRRQEGDRAAWRKSKSVAFLPVRVADPSARGDISKAIEAEILLQGGRRVRVAGAMSLRQLADLLDAVEGGVRC